MPMRNFTSPKVPMGSLVESNRVLISLFALVARKLTVPFKYELVVHIITIGK